MDDGVVASCLENSMPVFPIFCINSSIILDYFLGATAKSAISWWCEGLLLSSRNASSAGIPWHGQGSGTACKMLHYEFCRSTSWPIITLPGSQGSMWIHFPLSTSVRQLLADKTLFFPFLFPFFFFLTNVKISVMKVISLVLHKQSFMKYICTVPFLCNKSISQITVMCKGAVCCFLAVLFWVMISSNSSVAEAFASVFCKGVLCSQFENDNKAARLPGKKELKAATPLCIAIAWRKL